MYYSGIGILALILHLIINAETLFKKSKEKTTLVQRKELQDTVIITGGFSDNEFFAGLLSKKLGQTAHAMPLGRYAGAYGAALLAKDHSQKKK